MSSITPCEITVKNLNNIRQREDELSRLRTLVIGELPLPELPEAAQLRDIVRLWRRLNEGEAPDATSRIELCRRIYREYDAGEHRLSPLLFPRRDSVISYLRTGEGTQPVISYVGNPYSDEARRRLLGQVSLREHGCRSFGELCEDISSGSSDGCIIPLENTTDGKLMSFYSIIDRFELKIFRVCDIESSDGTQSTRYALLTRHADAPEIDGEHYLEFSVTASDIRTLHRLLDAAERMTLDVCRLDSIPQHYDEAAMLHYLVSHGRSDALLCYLLYLELEQPGYTLIGLYDSMK